ncbi:Zinc-type alcohol dehydrogenase-like protein [Pseudocercospora fuligena]|uniref:Zinc-type alcohol dehydrogenase-like protein n=1 Tax=Pseudocercospora fuligena TaxID=685502 RepID=A0A8H6RV43_9PEZI|nr:Zinc-type alcohol dehydrogenase-like protein [Pseudocercospora fuligena]
MSTYRTYHIRKPSPSVLESQPGFHSLTIEHDAIPTLKANEVLVKIHAVSLNYRDLWMPANIARYPTPEGLIPCSDCAGEITQLGPSAKKFAIGDRVCPIMIQTWIYGQKDLLKNWKSVLGNPRDGVLREYAVFDEEGLVKIPEHLSWQEAACLPCAYVTAWNALFGGDRSLKLGDTLLTHGTGPVSLAAVQFAVAAGAEIIATTSTKAKEERLRGMGVRHVINYRDIENWGEEAKKLSFESRGADFVVDIGGMGTLEQSYKAVRTDGVILGVGQRGGKVDEKDGVGIDEAFQYSASFRKVMVGSRQTFEEMCRAIRVSGFQPMVDEKVFAFEDAREAYRYLYDQKHLGNVVIGVG